MLGQNRSFGLSVLKREAKPKEDVETFLQRNGWERTGEIGQRVSYYENSGVNITLVEGPRGTVILPSGPIRGTIFGKDNKLVSENSVIGAGSGKKETDAKSQIRGSKRSDNTMV
mgnify:CR=1 FL=1